MNKLIIVTALFGIMHLSVPAQEPVLNSVLTGYYKVKDALVSSDSKAAAAASADLLQSITKIDMSAIPVKDHMAFMNLQNKLAFDSRHISESTDINHQREHFTSLSANMGTLAKQAHLAQEPVYQEYCPMKKSYWLSSDTAIKNPYYGASMPDCGKVTATLKP
jgi:Protein of unknown function (DUF3347)